MNRPRTLLRFLVVAGLMTAIILLATSVSASAERSLLEHLFSPGALDITVQAEPERILPGWNPHHTCIVTNSHSIALTNLELFAPVPEGLCLPQNGERGTIHGEYDADRDAMVWRKDRLEPGESVVAHVVWHSYSTVAHGQQISARFEYRADGYGGAVTSDPVIVDRAKGQAPGAANPVPTLTLTPSPVPSPTPAAILRLEPETLTLERNQRQVITCTVDGVEGLYGIDIELAYDPSAITVYDAVLGTAGTQIIAGEAPAPDFVVRNEVDTDPGSIRYVATQLYPREAFDGSGVVLSLMIGNEVGGDGQTAITWVNHEMAHSRGWLIGHRIGPDVVIDLLPTYYTGPNPPFPGPAPTEEVPDPGPTPEITGDPQVSIIPSQGAIAVGDEVEVSVVISQVKDLYGADIRFTFDPTLLEALDADPSIDGAQVIQGVAPYPDFCVINEVVSGEARYAVCQMNPRPSFRGDGLAFTMRARASAAGECALMFTNCQLVDRNGDKVDANQVWGSIAIE